MDFKALIIELFQASSFAAILAFLFGVLGLERVDHFIELAVIAFVFGGIPMMLAKRFVVSFIRETKQSN